MSPNHTHNHTDISKINKQKKQIAKPLISKASSICLFLLELPNDYESFCLHKYACILCIIIMNI